MLPRRGRRGKPFAMALTSRTRMKLQWGHGEVAVEDAVEVNQAAARGRASMGPRRGRRGRPRTLELNDARLTMLQWGHGEVAVEDMVFQIYTIARLPQLQWEPRRGRRGRLEDGRQVMVYVHELQWGHGEVAVEDDTNSCLNRARDHASMGPRRGRRGRLLDRHEAEIAELASMGPRRGRRGRRDAVRQEGTRGEGASNGATARSPWKTLYPFAPYRERFELKWGHGEVAVEDAAVRSGGDLAPQASMGPRRGRRGRLSEAGRSVVTSLKLQWGHGEVAVEDPGGARVALTAYKMLQWGHGEFAVDDCPLPDP